MTALEKMGSAAKEASRILGTAGTAKKNEALAKIADALIKDAATILEANGKDIKTAEDNGMNSGLIDRLTLTQSRISGIAEAVRKIITLDDPVGKILGGSVLTNGLTLTKVSVPLGVIAVIFEARPNVTADASALCLKSGNTVILRGGREAMNSNRAIVSSMRAALTGCGLPADCIQLIEDTSHETANELMRLNKYIDVLIPRGGAGLIRAVVENASVPVIETGLGNCHIYVDAAADIDMAADIIYNAKTSRVSVCNACESLLFHKDIAEPALIAVNERLKEKNVTVYGDEAVCAVLPDARRATEEDWGREYLDYKISAKVVRNIDEAISHIAAYSTHHSDCIITNDIEAAEKFTKSVDSAAVYVNASTRFTDGGEFGFGAEIGISTQKLHARGPVGLSELTSYKYIVRGSGQVR